MTFAADLKAGAGGEAEQQSRLAHRAKTRPRADAVGYGPEDHAVEGVLGVEVVLHARVCLRALNYQSFYSMGARL